MKKQQTKIAKTYRLLPETVEDIQIIKESFRNQRYEFSSDAAVIQYSVGVAKDLVKSVDHDEITLRFTQSELESILQWSKYHESDFGRNVTDQQAYEKIKHAFETF